MNEDEIFDKFSDKISDEINSNPDEVLERLPKETKIKMLEICFDDVTEHLWNDYVNDRWWE